MRRRVKTAVLGHTRNPWRRAWDRLLPSNAASIRRASESKIQSAWSIYDNEEWQDDEKRANDATAAVVTPTPTPTAETIIHTALKIQGEDMCPSCGSQLVVLDESGFPVCSNETACGKLYRLNLDFGPDWRYFGADDRNPNDPTRCGNPINPMLKESSFTCRISFTNSHGMAATQSFGLYGSKQACRRGLRTSNDMRKIARWTEWQSIPHREKSLASEFQYITSMAQNAGINRMFIDDALIIHKEISEQQIFRGCNRDGLKAASIYISCRLNGCPRTSQEIAEIFHLNKADTTCGCSAALSILNNIERNLDMVADDQHPSSSSGSSLSSASSPDGGGVDAEVPDKSLAKPGLRDGGFALTETSSHSPFHYDPQKIHAETAQNESSCAFVERHCSRLGMAQEYVLVCLFVAKQIEKRCLITDKTPNSMVAGILFFVSHLFQLQYTKQEIKRVCGVSEVTINKCLTRLNQLQHEVIPPCLLGKTPKPL